MSQTLLERIAAGDRNAMEECMNHYGRLIWSLARRFNPRTEDAEEAVQEIFVDLWSSAGRFDPAVASETTFVAMIARRRLIDRLRKRQREPQMDELEASAASEAPRIQEELETAGEAAVALRFLRTLRPEQQRVLRLSILSGASHPQIAERLGLPLGTVKTHIRRGLLSLRRKLREAGHRPPQEART